ncbi:uncharacterized protein [Epargyreus clarus]|uniref:uncharacterized protein n=1 Tax=Epargyreus clarus TaxID=520877 RepID=UPI003C2F0241
MFKFSRAKDFLSTIVGKEPRNYFIVTVTRFPTPLDALVYGHMRALLSARGPKAAVMIKPITNVLLAHVLRMTDLTQMMLTPQEEFLISQAFSMIARPQIMPERRTSKICTRIKRSKMCINPSRDHIPMASDGDSSDAKSTQRIQSSEDISVEALLESLRKKNAIYGSYSEMAELD